MEYAATAARGRNAEGRGGGQHLDSVDPVLEAIATFRKAMEDFNKNAPTDDVGADAYAARSFRVPLMVIERWQQPALTAQGAVEALRLARDADADGDYAMVGPMISAALSYFEAAG